MKIEVTNINEKTVLHSVVTGVGAYVITRTAYKVVQKVTEYRHWKKEEEERTLRLRELEEVDQLLRELRSMDLSAS